MTLNGTAIATFAYDQDGRLTQSRTGASLTNSTFFTLTSPRQYTANHREMYRGSLTVETGTLLSRMPPLFSTHVQVLAKS